MNTQVQVRVNCWLNVFSLDAHWCGGGDVLLSPGPSPLSCWRWFGERWSVFLVIPIWYASNDGRFIWELLDMAVVRVPEVWTVLNMRHYRQRTHTMRAKKRADTVIITLLLLFIRAVLYKSSPVFPLCLPRVHFSGRLFLGMYPISKCQFLFFFFART